MCRYADKPRNNPLCQRPICSTRWTNPFTEITNEMSRASSTGVFERNVEDTDDDEGEKGFSPIIFATVKRN